MLTITSYILSAAYMGDPNVRVQLRFDGVRGRNDEIVVPAGAEVFYRVTDGAHTIEGSDLRAPMGWRSTPEDLLRALCDFLTSDAEHVDAHDRGVWEHPCPEYGKHCPALRSGYAKSLWAMADTLAAIECVNDELGGDDPAA